NEKRRERGEEELAPIGLHELRHAFASLARAAELDLKAIQTYMGHSSSQTTTDLYSHLFKEEADIAAGRLDAYLTPEEDAEARTRASGKTPFRQTRRGGSTADATARTGRAVSRARARVPGRGRGRGLGGTRHARPLRCRRRGRCDRALARLARAPCLTAALRITPKEPVSSDRGDGARGHPVPVAGVPQDRRPGPS